MSRDRTSPLLIAHRSLLHDLSERKPFLLRIDPAVLQAVQRWANDDLRSLNGQIEWILRRALSEARRGKVKERQNRQQSSDQQSAR